MPFEILSPLEVTLKSVTIRNEKHGDDDVTGITMGLRATVPNTFLDLIDPTLRQAIYTAVPDQEQLPGVEPATPLLRSRSIDTLHLKQCFEGWTLEIDHGINESDPIKLGGSKVDKWVATPKEGGSVELSFRVGSNDIDATEIGLIGAKLAQEISIRLTAPVKTEGPAIDGTTGHPGAAAAASDSGPDAGDLFAGAVRDELAAIDAESDQHAGDFGTADEADLAAEAERGENWPFPTGETGPVKGAADEASNDAAELEAGMSKAIADAGLKPKAARRPRRAAGGSVE